MQGKIAGRAWDNIIFTSDTAVKGKWNILDGRETHLPKLTGPKTSFGALWTPYGGFWNEMRNNIT